MRKRIIDILKKYEVECISTQIIGDLFSCIIESKWVKDKQPEIPKGSDEIEVLALNGDGLIIDCWFEADWQFYDCTGSNITNEITYWMPLPEPPKNL